MNWGQIGGVAAALVAVIAALYFFGLGGVLRVLRAVAGFLGDVAEAVRGWLKTPGNKVRGLCALFGFAFLAAGLQSWQRGTVIIQQRADYTALQERTKVEKQALAQEIEARDKTINQFIRNAQEQMRLLEIARTQSVQALAEAEAAKKRAAESQAKYQEAFNNKPPECTAALQMMAKACPSLENY